MDDDDQNMAEPGLFEDLPPSTSGAGNIGVEVPTITAEDGRTFAAFPTHARSEDKFDSGYKEYRFKEKVPIHWAEMFVITTRDMHESFLELPPGERPPVYLLSDKLKLEDLDHWAVYRFPEGEFVKRLNKAESFELLKELKELTNQDGFNRMAKQLLDQITDSNLSEMRFYYIQDPEPSGKNTLEDRKIKRFAYQNGSSAQKFMAIVLKLLIEAAKKLDSSKMIKGSENFPRYLFSWCRNKGRVQMELSELLRDIASKEQGVFRSFLNENNEMISKIAVNMFCTLIKGKNYDDAGIDVGMALTDLACLLMSCAKADRDRLFHLDRNQRVYGLRSAKVGCGNIFHEDQVYFQYMIADTIVIREDDQTKVVSALNPNHFMKSDYQQIYGCLSELRLTDKARTRIPRPTGSIRPDWCVKSGDGAIYLIGECKSTLDRNKPADFHVSITAAAHQLGYSKRSILVQTSSSCIRVYELCADNCETNHNRIPCTSYESASYDLKARHDETETTTKDNASHQQLPTFVTTRGDFRHYDRDVATDFENLNVRVRQFMKIFLDVADRIAVLLLRRDEKTIDFNYTMLKKSGLISAAEDPGCGWHRPVDPQNLWRLSEQTYMIMKQYYLQLMSDTPREEIAGFVGNLLRSLGKLEEEKKKKGEEATTAIKRLMKEILDMNDLLLEQTRDKYPEITATMTKEDLAKLPQVMHEKGSDAEKKRKAKRTFQDLKFKVDVEELNKAKKVRIKRSREKRFKRDGGEQEEDRVVVMEVSQDELEKLTGDEEFDMEMEGRALIIGDTCYVHINGMFIEQLVDEDLTS